MPCISVNGDEKKIAFFFWTDSKKAENGKQFNQESFNQYNMWKSTQAMISKKTQDMRYSVLIINDDSRHNRELFPWEQKR